MACIKVEEVLKKYSLSREELKVLANSNGVFMTDKDKEVCGVPEHFLSILEAYVQLREELDRNDFVQVDKHIAKILVQLGYTVVEYYNTPYVTKKYRVVKFDDARLLTDQKDRARIVYIGRKTLVPVDLYEKIQLLKKKESERKDTIVVDVV